ncbi:MAG: FkbM family methyltransferase [Actinobacteria bacterium]|nr:FkbM family methyltransferase [Actinomycetota bacterium]
MEDNPFSQFRDDIHFTLYDADMECIEKDKRRHEPISSSINYEFIPTAISNKAEKRMFYINNEPSSSSLLEFNNEFSEFIDTAYDWNFSLEKELKPQKKILVECHSLDELFMKKEINPPDFLLVDVEGADYDVLEGADKLLDYHILGVISEVEFVNLRKNQKKFDEIFKYLTKKKFFLTSLECRSTLHYANSLNEVRGTGFVFIGDALFLKKYREIIESNIDENDKIIMLFKLATISLCYDALDYAYQILRDMNELYRDSIPKLLHSTKFIPRYIQLCIEYFEKYKRLMSQKAKEQEFFGSIKEYYCANPLDISFQILPERIKSFLKRNLLSQKIFSLMLSTRVLIKLIFGELYYYILPMDEIESTLWKYGLFNQAKSQKKRRINIVYLEHKLGY